VSMASTNVRPMRRRKRAPGRFRIIQIVLALLMGGAGMMLTSDGLFIKAKAVVAQHLLKSAWARTRNGEVQARPWPWADISPVLRISVPRLDRSAIVLSGVSGQALAFGPGLIEGSAMPGQPGLSIVAAHRDTHFRFLKDVEIGDEIEVADAQGDTYIYRIIETLVVDAAASGLVPGEGEARLALVTCYPIDGATRGPRRFVAIAELQPRGHLTFR